MTDIVVVENVSFFKRFFDNHIYHSSKFRNIVMERGIILRPALQDLVKFAIFR